MSTDDNKKKSIVWKRSSQNDSDAQGSTAASDNNSTDTSKKIVFKRNGDAENPAVSPVDLATNAAAYTAGAGLKDTDTQSIDALRAEIEQSFGSEDTSSVANSSKNSATHNPDESPLLPITPKATISELDSKESFMPPTAASKSDAAAQETAGAESIAQDNHDALVASLKADIHSDFANQPIEDKKEENTQKNTGVGQTYYSDLSTAMGANEPATMSELIKKSRFEKKEAMILSPKSKRNIMFIGGAIALLLASIAVISTIFGSKTEPIEFVSEERVSSLVFANQDTGINVTGLESEKTKQAIRKVIEKKIPEDTINQIYYVEKTPNGAVRRLGVKDIFDKTDNQTPKLLYDNIENDFTHGVYRTDRNYPFIILKALSYDRALKGMKEWEPTMLDDVATYFDLPPEATDRSLIKDGFEDDLIRNKNVRVSRFLPREVDGRGILDLLRLGGNSADSTETDNESTTETDSNLETTQPATTINTNTGVEVDQNGNVVDNNDSGVIDNVVAYIAKKIQSIAAEFKDKNSAYAQGTGGGFLGTNTPQGANQRICYSVRKSCISRSTGLQVTFRQGDPTQLCSDIRTDNVPIPATPALESDVLNYSCVNTLSGGDALTGGEAIDQLTTTESICFNNQNGERLASFDSSQFCFASYVCYLTECRAGNRSVPEGSPGAQCGLETNIITSAEDPRPKVCKEFRDILSYQNINESPICFDNEQNYLKYKTPNDPRLGFNCIAPQNRSNRICITQSEQVVMRTGNEIFSTDQFCFTQNENAATNIGANDQCGNLTIPQIQSRLALAVISLRLVSGIGQLFNLSDQDVSNINEAAAHIGRISQKNVLQVEEIRVTALILQNVEEILNRIDPNQKLPLTGPNGGLNLHGMLRKVIDTVKCTLGIANTLQWSTLAQIRIPQGFTIFAGQAIEGVEPVQQTLALIGLMDPLSVTGSLDLVTQDAISQFQLANALAVTGILDPETLDLLQTIIDGQDSLYGDQDAIINNYFTQTNGTLDANGNIITNGATAAEAKILTLGSYNDSVQDLQVLLYAEGYEIAGINGLFDEQTCSAVQQFQADNELEISDPVSCALGPDTIDALNDVIRSENYLGSGFGLNPQGFLQGIGNLEGNFGPGVANFEVNPADADSLNEGDIVLMYMFLDERTILIARDQIVIDEVTRRRSLSDIFNN